MDGEVGRKQPRLVVAMDAIENLAEEIGPRPPTSMEEKAAARWFASALELRGLSPEIEEFPAYRSFGRLYIPIFLLSLLGSLRRRFRLLGALGAGTAAFLGYREGEFSSTRDLNPLFPGTSQNVSAVIEPKGESKRTLCLVCHLDSSRSGLMFHPKVGAYLGWIVAAVSAMVGLNGVLSLLGRWSRFARVIRLGIVAALGLVVERELRGRDVPGANDNASGVGVCLALTEELAVDPLEHTRVVVLATGAEEAGVLGMRHFLDVCETDTWLFLNFDGVGAAAPLRYLRVEGGPLSPRRADSLMVELVEKINAEQGLSVLACDHGSGLPYDSTAVLARGGRALTLTAQGRAIPNYHWPTDRSDQIDRETVEKTIRLAQEMLAEIDRGAADRA